MANKTIMPGGQPALPLLKAAGISKSFGGVRALDGVDFDVQPGEVHALIGENGAGKSTLMNVLAGRFADYTGEITFHGEPVRLTDPRQALAQGIVIIYQELSVLPNLTVAENIMLGREPPGRLRGSLDRAAIRAAARRTLDYLQFDLPLDAEVERLSAARQCLVEIARAVQKEARLLVLDEPTASLGSADADKLFAVIRDLKARGLGIVYISHRLAELPRIADRVTVLRDGRAVGTRPMAGGKLSDLTRMMLGHELGEMFPTRAPRPGPVLLSVRGLTRRGVFENIAFDLHAGEILGIAGRVGSGRTEIARAIVGADPAEGACLFKGRTLRRRPDRCRQDGLCLVPENRKRDGNITGRPVAENLNAGILKQMSGPLGFLAPRRLRARAEAMIGRMNVQPPSPALEIQKLSGGNQQKVIVGRTLAADPQAIIFDEPTQGIDVGAKAQLYRLIAELAAEGRGIILISSEFVELAELCDRILILREGRLAGEWRGEHADEEALYAACVGAEVA